MSLSAYFDDQQPIEQWMNVEFIANRQEKAFSSLPKPMRSQTIWTPDDFQTLADFARSMDDKARPTLK
nr:hypothetical protein [Vibrio sp. B1REV9]